MSVAWVLIGLAVACEIPLLVARRLFPRTAGYLPLGGDDLTQLGILVLTAVFLGQAYELVPQLIRFLIT